MNVSESTVKQVIREYYAGIGRQGGQQTSDKKARAAAENGKKGGRPRKPKLQRLNKGRLARPASGPQGDPANQEQPSGEAMTHGPGKVEHPAMVEYRANKCSPVTIAIASQRSGVGKTTTAVSLARKFADIGLRVLLIDAEVNNGLQKLLGLRPTATLRNLLLDGFALEHCVTPVYAEEIGGKIDVITGETVCFDHELVYRNIVTGEHCFRYALHEQLAQYDVAIVDVSAEISFLANAAMRFAERLVLPIAMDPLAALGCLGAIAAAEALNAGLVRPMLRDFYPPQIRPLALLPTMYDPRYRPTEMVMDWLSEFANETHIPVLTPIRLDRKISKLCRKGKFLDFFEQDAALSEDYEAAAMALMELVRAEKRA